MTDDIVPERSAATKLIPLRLAPPRVRNAFWRIVVRPALRSPTAITNIPDMKRITSQPTPRTIAFRLTTRSGAVASSARHAPIAEIYQNGSRSQLAEKNAIRERARLAAIKRWDVNRA